MSGPNAPAPTAFLGRPCLRSEDTGGPPPPPPPPLHSPTPHSRCQRAPHHHPTPPPPLLILKQVRFCSFRTFSYNGRDIEIFEDLEEAKANISDRFSKNRPQGRFFLIVSMSVFLCFCHGQDPKDRP